MVNLNKITVIKGDGIGPEVIESSLKVLDAVGFKADYTEADAGYECYTRCGTSIPEKTIEMVASSDATIFGAVTSPPNIPGFKSAIVTLRQRLDLFANLRPVKSWPGNKNNIDLYVVRENTEGMYSGVEGRHGDSAYSLRIITKKGSERIIRFAFDLAKSKNIKKVTLVHKANVLRETCGLFRQVGLDMSSSYPDIEMEEVIVDAMAMRLVKEPEKFKIIVTTNLFGDILADEAIQIAGGLGLAPSANIGKKALFEPVHGSAPKYTGKNVVNPIATIMAAKMMLDWLGETKKAVNIENAVYDTLSAGKVKTKDLGGSNTTTEMTEEIISLVS